jgi:Uma2 family endonuclease
MSNAVENAPKLVRGGQVWLLSVPAYRVLNEAGLIPENTELLYGMVYRKMAKSPYHSALVTRMLDLVSEPLPFGFFLRCEQPITCENSEPEPDIAIIRGEKRDFWQEHPRTAQLVIEICVTSHEYDRAKLPAYASAGVKECWLVLGPDKQIEVYREPTNGEYLQKSLHGPGGTLASAAVPGLNLSLEILFTK